MNATTTTSGIKSTMSTVSPTQTSQPIPVPISTSEPIPIPTSEDSPGNTPIPVIVTVLVPTIISGTTTSMLVTSMISASTTPTPKLTPTMSFLPLPENSNSSNNAGIIVGSLLGALLFLLILALILFFLNKKRNDRKKLKRISSLPSFISPGGREMNMPNTFSTIPQNTQTFPNVSQDMLPIPIYGSEFVQNQNVSYVLNDGYGRDISYNENGEPLFAILSNIN